MTSPTQTPKLTALADACNDGACNIRGLVHSLAEAIIELPASEAKDHPAVKVILGQLSFLCGESIGPTTSAHLSYLTWRNNNKTRAA